MRLSVVPSDPGYSLLAFNAKAYLDGVELKYCTTADEELGVAYCYTEGEDGEVTRNEIFGNITIKINT